MSIEGVVISGFVTLAVAWLGYLGLRDQNRTAKAGSDHNTQTAATDSALKAWETLLEPYRQEVQSLRTEVGELRARGGEQDQKLNALTDELHRWQRVAKTIARWAITMRDQLRADGRDVPAEPDELMTLQIISDSEDQRRSL